MKRLAALILALMFVFGLVGCNNRNINCIYNLRYKSHCS